MCGKIHIKYILGISEIKHWKCLCFTDFCPKHQCGELAENIVYMDFLRCVQLEWLIWLTCYISFHYICISGHSSSIQYISNTFFHSRLITVDSNLLYTFYIVYSIDVLLYVLLTCNALFTCCQLGINNIYIKQLIE